MSESCLFDSRKYEVRSQRSIENLGDAGKCSAYYQKYQSARYNVNERILHNNEGSWSDERDWKLGEVSG